MARLSMNAEVLRQIRRRVGWGVWRAIRSAFRYPNHAATARMVLLLLALGLSGLLAERCVVLRDQAELMTANDSVVVPVTPFSSESAEDPVLMPVAAIPEILGRFDSVAREFSLRLERIDYRKEIAFTEKGSILRVNTMHVGNAEKVFAMSASLLQAFPGLSLAAIKLTRDRVESPDGEAQMSWIVFLEPAGSKEEAR